MIDLFLPYLIGLALGITPQEAPQAAPTVARPVLEDGSGDAPDGRVPEEQIATGQFTTAIEVQPILEMTQANWVAVRAVEGQDWLYFTHLLAWRCGLWDIHYGLNGAPADQPIALEPCHLGTAQPNALVDIATYPPYVIQPFDSIESVTVQLTFDDATTQTATFARPTILLP